MPQDLVRTTLRSSYLCLTFSGFILETVNRNQIIGPEQLRDPQEQLLLSTLECNTNY